MPWPLGPPDGRYLIRPAAVRDDALEPPPSHILVVATLGATRRGRRHRARRTAEPAPAPTPVPTGRATVISVAEPFGAKADGHRWLRAAGEEQLAADLSTLNRALHAFRLIAADPHVHPIARTRVLVARIGFGDGEQVADGRWSAAVELMPPVARTRRSTAVEPQALLAAALRGREPALACAELALRARLDLDAGRDRLAALELRAALDAALTELPEDRAAGALEARLQDLLRRRDVVAELAERALAGELGDSDREAIAVTLGRLEAALRARAAASLA